MNRKRLHVVFSLVIILALLLGASAPVIAQVPQAQKGGTQPPHLKHGKITQADRKAAAQNAAAAGLQVGVVAPGTLAATQGSVPDYFGPFPNWAYSPLPSVDPVSGAVSGGLL